MRNTTSCLPKASLSLHPSSPMAPGFAAQPGRGELLPGRATAARTRVEMMGFRLGHGYLNDMGQVRPGLLLEAGGSARSVQLTANCRGGLFDHV